MEDSTKCKIQFIYKYKGSKYDDVGVVGNLEELKYWNINNPVNLTYSENEQIYKSNPIYISHNTNIEYKYVFFSNNEHKWEQLPYNQNRKIEIKNESSLILEDIQDNPKTKIKNEISAKPLKKKGSEGGTKVKKKIVKKVVQEQSQQKKKYQKKKKKKKKSKKSKMKKKIQKQKKKKKKK